MKAARAERIYARQLSRLAEHVGHIITGFAPDGAVQIPTLSDMLRKYAEALTPWAVSTAQAMLEEVNQRDLAAWKSLSAELSDGLRRELASAPTGEIMRRLLADQVGLIKSIPIDAAQRVHDLTLKGLEDGARASEVAAEIMRSGEVARSRAMTIARTEVARAATTLTQARAEHAGSTHYVWMTSKDSTVRADHKRLSGLVFAWNDPPVADIRSGARAHPGCIYNCRCWAKPVLGE